MQTLKSFLDQSLLIWKDSTAAARFGLGLLLVIFIGSVVGVGVWSAQPNYVVLADKLDPSSARKIMDALDSADIGFDVRGAGSTIRVDQRKWSLAQVVAGEHGVNVGGPVYEAQPNWPDPTQSQIISRRNREAQLEYSIKKFKSVSDAEVHLSIPEKQAFLRKTTAPAASVLLTLSRGPLDDAEAVTIARMVANGVPGLSSDQVVITDTAGTQYSTNESMAGLSRQEKFRVRRNHELTEKAESILARLFGIGNASVSVTAEFAFPNEEKKSITFDPKGKVVTEETISSSQSTKELPGIAAGATGTASNVGNASGSGGRGPDVLTKTEDLTSKYDQSMTEVVEHTTTPIQTKMDVTVAINSAALKEGQDTPEFRQMIQDMVQTAVGFDDVKDNISLAVVEFVDTLPTDIPVAFTLPWDQINQLVKNISLGIAALIAFLMARKAFKKIQPDPSTGSDIGDRRTQVNELSELVEQNPEVFAKIIASWSSLDEDNESENTTTRAAA